DPGAGPGIVPRPADLVGSGYFVRRFASGRGVRLGGVERVGRRVVESGDSILGQSPARRHRRASQPAGTPGGFDPTLPDADAGIGERDSPVAGHRRRGSAGHGSAGGGDGGRVSRPGSASPSAGSEAERAASLTERERNSAHCRTGRSGSRGRGCSEAVTIPPKPEGAEVSLQISPCGGGSLLSPSVIDARVP